MDASNCELNMYINLFMQLLFLKLLVRRSCLSTIIIHQFTLNYWE